MKKNRKRKHRFKKKIKTASKAALIAPLIVSGSAIMEVAAQPSDFAQWVSQRLNGSIDIGQTIALDLTDYFQDLDETSIMVINHNDWIADVSIDGTILLVSGKAVGSTAVALHFVANESDRYERFRVDVNWPELWTDSEEDRIGIDDLVRYMRNSSESFLEQDIVHMMSHISPVIEQENRLPVANDEVVGLDIEVGETITAPLDDYFYDADGDALIYDFIYTDQAVDIAINGNEISFTGQEVTDEPHLIYVTAREYVGSEHFVEKQFRVSVREAVPEALIEEISFTLLKSQELAIHMEKMFDGNHLDEFTLFAYDEQGKLGNRFESYSGYLLGIVDGSTFNVSIYSSDTVDATLNVSFRAGSRPNATVLSDPVDVVVHYKPDELDPIEVNNEWEGSMEELFSDVFADYLVNDIHHDFTYSFENVESLPAWISVNQDSDIVTITPDDNVSAELKVIVTSSDGAIQISSTVVIDVSMGV